MVQSMTRKTKDKNILMHYKGYEEFVLRLLDIGERVRRYQGVIYTPFLNEYEQEIVAKVLFDCHIKAFGGYDNSEYKRCAISFYEEDIYDNPIVCLQAKFDAKFQKLEHKDVLGALMNLGIERDQIGDILVQDDYIYVFVCEEMSMYVSMQCNQIRRSKVVFSVSDHIPEVEKKIAYQEKIVSSMRLDAVVATICNCNREKAKRMIQAKHVKVNQVILEDCTYLCNNKSTVSIKRYGRFTIQIAERKTRKDNFVIVIGKYL